MKRNILLLLIIMVTLSIISVLRYQSEMNKDTRTPFEIAVEVCGRCIADDLDARSIIERPDGIVVLGIAGNRGGRLLVIDTKKKSITDETGPDPYLVIDGTIITTGLSQDMSKLRILKRDSREFTFLDGSLLPTNETYDTSESQEFTVAWDATSTAQTMRVGVYPANESLEKRPFKRLYQKEFDIN